MAYNNNNNVFCLLFKLSQDCSASGMFGMDNVPTCPGLVRRLVFDFYEYRTR